MARAKKKVEPVEVEERTGRKPDPVRYEMYSDWLRDEKGIELDPQALQDCMTNYHEFQRSEINVNYNAERRALREQEAEERRARREAREAAGAPSRGRPAKKTASKKTSKPVEVVEEPEAKPVAKRVRKRPARKPAAA